MNEYKIMVEISFPKLDRIIDVALPVNKTIYYCLKMLEELISDNMSPGYKATGNEILVDKVYGKVLDKNALVKESGIGNGSRLVYY